MAQVLRRREVRQMRSHGLEVSFSKAAWVTRCHEYLETSLNRAIISREAGRK